MCFWHGATFRFQSYLPSCYNYSEDGAIPDLDTVFDGTSGETSQYTYTMVPEPPRQQSAFESDPSVLLWPHKRLPHSHHGTPANEHTGFAWPGPTIDSDIKHPSASIPLQQPRIARTPPMPQWPSQLSDLVPWKTPPYEQQMLMATMAMAPPPIPSIEHGMPIPSRPKSNPRRTLTDEDRKRMCEYAQANPGTKQIDIGRMSTAADLLNVQY